MSMPRVEEDDGEQRRRRKLEEALEVKSLRRIISAYLNYPDAAEEDVKRYERSYKRLPPAHKDAESSRATEERAIRYMPFEISDVSTDRIRFYEEGQPIEDIELEIEHKLNEMRVNMYFDFDLDAIFYLLQDSVTEADDVPPLLSLEDSTAESVQRYGVPSD